MLRGIVGSSLRFPLLVIGLAGAAMLLGYFQLSRVSVETLPEFGPPYVEVQTEALGLSSEEVEELITVPLEADLLHGVAFLDQIHSQSVPGLSSIVLYFEKGTPVLRARQMVSERLTQAHALPNVSKSPAMIQPLSSSSRVAMVGLSSKTVSLIDMSVLARWTIRPRLLSVPGVANVSIWGQRERQLQVQVDPARLKERGVSLGHVIETAGNALWSSPLTFLDASTPGTGGFIDTPNQRLGIQHILPIRSPEDLAKVAVVQDVPAANGQSLVLGDVATVVEDHQPLIGDAVVNDASGLALVIEKFPDANTVEVTRNVEDALAALQPGLSGIEIGSSLFRPATYLESATDNLAMALLVGLLLIALVLGLILNRWRVVLISLVTIPLSLAAAGLLLLLLGASFNALVVAGLVLAVVVLVDDAVVAFDAVDQRVRQRGPEEGGRSAASIILESTLEARGPTVYATLIVGCALLPILLAGGVAGAFMPATAVAFALAVLASMVVSLTLTPALCLLLRTDTRTSGRESGIVRRLRLGYADLLERVIDGARVAVIVVAVAAIGAVALLGAAVVPQVAQSPLPEFRDSDLLIHWDAVPGTSGPEVSRIVGLASQELRNVPGVRDVGANTGRALLSDRVVGANSGELWLSLDPAADHDKTVASIQGVIDGYPGFRREMGTYSADRVNAVLPQAKADLVVRVYGQDLDILRAQADAVTNAVAGVHGVAAARVEGHTEEPTLKIAVDIDAADRVGLKPGDIRRDATTLLSGIQVGSLFEEDKVFDVVVWGIPDIRLNLTNVGDLPIDTPDGGQVRLGDVASVTIAPSPTVIRREGVFRFVDIDLDVAGGDLATVANDVHSAIRAVAMPLEYRAEVLGDYADRLLTQTRILAAAIAAAIVIFLLLQAAFQSWRLAALVFLTLPAALVGGAIAAIILGGGMSLGTLLGFFAVLAVAVRTEILLVSHYQRVRRDGELAGRALILRAASERFTPIIATAVATALAFAPFVLLGNVPGYEVVRPMAIVVLGGIVTSLLLNLFIVPALYLRVAPSPESHPSTQLVRDQPAFEPTAS
jgi:Cu/Ag efflux pump CusA